MIVDAYYRLIGDLLVVGEQPVGPDADVSKARHIKFDGDVLIETGPDGSVVRKERVGAGTKSSQLVGSWKYRHYTNAVAFERYTDDGRMSFRIPMKSSVGCYVLKGDELVLMRPNQPDGMMRIDQVGDTLSLVSDGRTAEYRRVSADPWYEMGQSPASSPIPIQLRSVKAVQLRVSSKLGSGRPETSLEREIVERLLRSGLQVKQYWDQSLEATVVSEQVPNCDLVAIWVSVKLTDQVLLTRDKTLDLSNNPAVVWEGNDRGFSTTAQAAQQSTKMLLSQVDHFVDLVKTVAKSSNR